MPRKKSSSFFILVIMTTLAPPIDLPPEHNLKEIVIVYDPSPMPFSRYFRVTFPDHYHRNSQIKWNLSRKYQTEMISGVFMWNPSRGYQPDMISRVFKWKLERDIVHLSAITFQINHLGGAVWCKSKKQLDQVDAILVNVCKDMDDELLRERIPSLQQMARQALENPLFLMKNVLRGLKIPEERITGTLNTLQDFGLLHTNLLV